MQTTRDRELFPNRIKTKSSVEILTIRKDEKLMAKILKRIERAGIMSGEVTLGFGKERGLH